MEKRTLEITLEMAKEWYRGDNEVLKNLALQAFTETELKKILVLEVGKNFVNVMIFLVLNILSVIYLT